MAEKNVESSGKTVKELFKDDVVYSIPPFQRHYVWGEDNLDGYWEDLESLIKLETNPNETSFLGALVLQEDTDDSTTGDTLARYIVIDGQQRLTTFYLTLLALLAYAIERGKKLHEQEDKSRMDTQDFHGWTKRAGKDNHRIYLFSREENSEGKVKLVPTLSDHAQFNSILSELNAGLEGLAKLTGEREKVLPQLVGDKKKLNGKKKQSKELFDAHHFLQQKIQLFIEGKKRDTSEQEEVYNKTEQRERYDQIWRALTNRTVVVQIIAGPNLSPYEIFDRLNTKGVRLGTLDWVRNYTFGKATLGTSEKAEEAKKFNEEVWTHFGGQLKGVKGIKDQQLQEKFFIAYGAIKIKSFTTRNKDSHLKEYWNEQIKINGEKKPYRGAELVVGSLEEYLPSYLALAAKKQLPENDINPWGLDSNLWRLIENIRDISLPEATYPFLMPVIRSSMEEGGLSVEHAKQAFEIVESFIVRLTLLGRSMASLTSVFQPLWADCGKEKMIPQSILRGIEDKYNLSWPNDDEIRRNILSVPVYKQKRAKYILIQYEKWWQGKKGAAGVVLDDCHIDHIMPSAKAGRGDHKQPEEKEREKLLCNTLGNLTLLDKGINLQKSARELVKDSKEERARLLEEEKNNKKKSVRKLLTDSSLASVKELLKDFDKGEHDSWEVKSIETRGEELGEWVIARFPLTPEKF